MIHPYKIGKAIKNFVKWLVITNYGRFVLGAILCLFGIFSEYSTIEFLIIGWAIFDYLLYAGVAIIILQTLWWFLRGLFLLYNHITK
jgi:hypothetical protein